MTDQTILGRGVPPPKRPKIDSTSSDTSEMLNQLLELPDDLLGDTLTLGPGAPANNSLAVNALMTDQSDRPTVAAGVLPGNVPGTGSNVQQGHLVNSNMNNQPLSGSVAPGYAASPHPLNASSPASAVVSTSADPTPTLPAISSSPAASNTMAAPSPNLRPSFSPNPPGSVPPMDIPHRTGMPSNPPPYYSPTPAQNHSPASSQFVHSPMGMRPNVRMNFSGPQVPGHVSPHQAEMGHSMNQYPGMHHQLPPQSVYPNPHPPPHSQGLPHPSPLMGPRPPLVPDGHPQGMPPSQTVGGVGMGGPPSGAASNDPEKRKLIQQQLVLLLHAHRCQQREREQQANGEFRPCGLPHCRTMKNVLNHMTECQAGRDCTFPHCASSRQIIYHWKNCQQQECPVCLPLKTASLGHKRDPIPYQMPGVPPSHHQPVMMQRMGGGVPPSHPSLGSTDYHPSLAGPPPGIGGLFGDPYTSPVGGHRGDPSRPSPSQLIFQPSLSLSQPPQLWHNEVTAELRSHLIKKLVEAIYCVPLQDPVALQDPRVAHLVQYAINVEKSMFENARSREAYYQLLAERIYRIRKELDERKRIKKERATEGNPLSSDNPSLINGVPDPAMLSTHSNLTPQPTPLSVPNMSLGSPSLNNVTDDSTPSLKTLPASTPSSSMNKPPSPSPRQRQLSETALSTTVAGVEVKQEVKGETMHNCGDVNSTQQAPVSVTANASTAVSDAGCGGKPLSVQSSDSPAVKQRLGSMSEPPHSIQPISSVKSERSDAPPSFPSSTTAISKSGPAKVQPNATLKAVFTVQEIKSALLPVFQKVWDQDPEAYPFRQPVDPTALGIPDYFNIIRNPIDLSAIHKRLCEGSYSNPWKFCEDMWLMFDNAWLYNKKTSRVYKFCTKLSEVFDEFIDTAMQSLGYCCGRRHAFHPQVLYCNGKPLCTVPRDSPYHGYQNKCVYCPKCFNEVEGDTITIRDGSVQDVPKSAFKEMKNDAVEYEPMVECIHCQRQMHRICVLHHDPIWPEGFQCANCLRALNTTLRENRFSAKRLPTTKLSSFLEDRVNSFLQNELDVGKVTIRVVSSSDKVLDTRMGMRERFMGEFPSQFPYRTKALFAFQEIDGVDVCFFGMHVQEYGSDCPAPNTRRVYISYLDSVYFFRPKQYRTLVYHEILIGYLQFCKIYGFQTAHIWACPPGEGDDYIFHCHPIEQKIPKPKRLVEWYRKMLDRGKQSMVVYDHKDIFRHCTDEEITMVTEIPYFEGDFWPNVIEETIKELDMEEEEERKASEAASVDNRAGPKKAGKRNTSKKGTKKAGASRGKNSKKSGLIIGGDLLSQKIYQTMEKHKEVFFVVLLQPPSQSPLPATTDPDSLITCDLMDGRDAFLNLARERHWEFSSLRRSRYSTQALLYELHQGGDRFVYTCNNCRSDIETRWHCTVCEDFDLCDSCYKISGHTHRMEKLEYESDTSEETQTNTVEARNNSIRRKIEYLIHASQCHDSNCRQPYCIKMKQLLRHTRDCKLRQAGTCMICKHFILLCVTHARECKENKCQLRVCASIKQKLREQRLQQQNRNFEHVQRRMHRMATLQAKSQQSSSPSSNSSPSNKSVLSPNAATQSPCPPVAPTPGKAAAASPNPRSVGKAAPSTPGDISTPKPPVAIPPSPMMQQNPGTPYTTGMSYAPINKPQESSPSMPIQQPVSNHPVNPEDNNLLRVIDAFVSPNAQEKMQAVQYLKDAPMLATRAIMLLRQRGRGQDATQLTMELGIQTQPQLPQYGYSPLQQQQQQPPPPQQPAGAYMNPSPIHIQPGLGRVPQRHSVPMNPQQQMIHHQPMQNSYPAPHPGVMHTQYSNTMVQPQRVPGSQVYNTMAGNSVGPMTANPPTHQSRLAQMLQAQTPQQYHNTGNMQYRMSAPSLGPPPQYSSPGVQGPVMRTQSHQPGYSMMAPQQAMGRPMQNQQMIPSGMAPSRPVPIGYSSMQDPTMSLYPQQQPHHQQQMPYGMNTNSNNSSAYLLGGSRTPHY